LSYSHRNLMIITTHGGTAAKTIRHTAV